MLWKDYMVRNDGVTVVEMSCENRFQLSAIVQLRLDIRRYDPLLPT